MEDSRTSIDDSNGHGLVHEAPTTVAGRASHESTGGMEQAAKVIDNVLYSDIGVSTLLTRLKQSIASARDFAGFLKKRSSLEEDHAQGLRKLCRATHETVRRPECRHGTYAQQLEEMTSLHERMADNGMQFALSLHQMHEDLNEMASNMEKGRKHWKTEGLAAEKRVQDAEELMHKAKRKYDSLAEDYDRVRTGDKTVRRGFNIGKSTAQQEEDLQRKVQVADSDYQARVEAALTQRNELVSLSRPEAVKSLKQLISECDSALTLQLQKYATFNEKLFLGNGLVILPVAEDDKPTQPSLRDIIYKIDNEKDFMRHVASFSAKIPSRPAEIKYEKHPTLQTHHTPVAAKRQSTPPHSQPPPSFNVTPAAQQSPQAPTQPAFSTVSSYDNRAPQFDSRDFGAGAPPVQHPGAPGPYDQKPQQPTTPHHYPGPQTPYGGQQPYQPPYQQHHPPQSFHQPPQQSSYQPPPQQTPYQPPPQQIPYQPPAPRGQTSGVTFSGGDMPPPTKPVFGVSLDDLFKRDGNAVPLVVFQCIQAVEMFGLDHEGIYRVSGNANQINQLKALFDHDSSQVDFRNPESFGHDINSVAGLLKQYLRELPDPLLTNEHYSEFIDAARIDDDIVRRDSLHAIVNSLPDPNYATLRSLVLHLNRVQEHSSANRMSTNNLAICLAPTLMGQPRNSIAEGGYQARVVDTIVQNTFQIFDED